MPGCRLAYFNPRSPRGERPPLSRWSCRRFVISIHAPREGSDRSRAEYILGELKFQSTLPARGATVMPPQLVIAQYNFNPRSPRGERRRSSAKLVIKWLFQSTLPARGATILILIFGVLIFTFQSTLPARGATGAKLRRTNYTRISIHAPREGSDEKEFRKMSERIIDFNPRSPRGERRISFYPTYEGHHISIHAPREGSDGLQAGSIGQSRNFNPRSPRGERHIDLNLRCDDLHISIHAPREGSDCNSRFPQTTFFDFNPRSPRGERLQRLPGARYAVRFQSTLPARGATPDPQSGLLATVISIHAPREGSDH